jgi:hypothetical protein
VLFGCAILGGLFRRPRQDAPDVGVKPDAAQAVVVSTHRWTGQHARTLVVVTSFVVGLALVVRGVLAL